MYWLQFIPFIKILTWNSCCCVRNVPSLFSVAFPPSFLNLKLTYWVFKTGSRRLPYCFCLISWTDLVLNIALQQYFSQRHPPTTRLFIHQSLYMYLRDICPFRSRLGVPGSCYTAGPVYHDWNWGCLSLSRISSLRLSCAIVRFSRVSPSPHAPLPCFCHPPFFFGPLLEGFDFLWPLPGC